MTTETKVKKKRTRAAPKKKPEPEAQKKKAIDYREYLWRLTKIGMYYVNDGHEEAYGEMARLTGKLLKDLGGVGLDEDLLRDATTMTTLLNKKHPGWLKKIPLIDKIVPDKYLSWASDFLAGGDGDTSMLPASPASNPLPVALADAAPAFPGVKRNKPPALRINTALPMNLDSGGAPSTRLSAETAKRNRQFDLVKVVGDLAAASPADTELLPSAGPYIPEEYRSLTSMDDLRRYKTGPVKGVKRRMSAGDAGSAVKRQTRGNFGWDASVGVPATILAPETRTAFLVGGTPLTADPQGSVDARLRLPASDLSGMARRLQKVTSSNRHVPSKRPPVSDGAQRRVKLMTGPLQI